MSKPVEFQVLLANLEPSRSHPAAYKSGITSNTYSLSSLQTKVQSHISETHPKSPSNISPAFQNTTLQLPNTINQPTQQTKNPATTNATMSSTTTSNIPLPPTLRFRPLPAPLPANLSTTTAASNNNNLPIIRQTPTTPVPCRRCLRDIQPGTPALLLSYDPFPIATQTPYRGATAIYLHAEDGTAAEEGGKDDDGRCRLADVARDFGGMVPQQQAGRRVEARAYDGEGMMVGWEGGVGGRDVVGVCEGLLLGGRAEYVHLYYAGPGCFAVRVERGGREGDGV
ncbi:uncharacterized protein BKCO1_25000134 [Diplodia corticola]|uniref:Uncharacterized protein n=1 Tax=Diplodia corticola TaxID=236234 RepID=A0A1J9R0L3_9PEZI|nr:uncharacterized protein BKCO1_25000134 [Diplodia corticola]OJD34168.1 hypothetical protein BKCO1_25000134 [Diplodia corticola]